MYEPTGTTAAASSALRRAAWPSRAPVHIRWMLVPAECARLAGLPLAGRHSLASASSPAGCSSPPARGPRRPPGTGRACRERPSEHAELGHLVFPGRADDVADAVCRGVGNDDPVLGGEQVGRRDPEKAAPADDWHRHGDEVVVDTAVVDVGAGGPWLAGLAGVSHELA